MAVAREGSTRALDFQPDGALETRGNQASDLACLNAAIDKSGVPAKVLADELGVSEGEFSKLRSGRFRVEQLARLRPEIRAEWLRLMDEEHAARGANREAVVLTRAAHALLDAIVVLKSRHRARAVAC